MLGCHHSWRTKLVGVLRTMAFVFLVLQLSLTPPFSMILGRIARACNPIAGLVHVQNTLNGAQTAIIASTAVKLGVFDALHEGHSESDGNQGAGDDDHASSLSLGWGFDLLEGWLRHLTGAPTVCRSAAWVAKRCNLKSTADAAELLDALAAIDFVQVCSNEPASRWLSWSAWWTSSGVPDEDRRRSSGFYRNSLATEWFVAGERSVGRMALVANHEDVVRLLARVGDQLQETEIATGRDTSSHSHRGKENEEGAPHGGEEHDGTGDPGKWRADLSDVWRTYAKETAGFNADVASSVATVLRRNNVLTPDRERDGRGESTATVLVDIGGGSGEYSRVILRAASSSVDTSSSTQSQQQPVGVLVDLPPVVDELENAARDDAQLAAASAGAASSVPKITFVRGSMFANETADALGKAIVRAGIVEQQGGKAGERSGSRTRSRLRVVLMMNSFVQHFSQADVSKVLARVVSACRQHAQESFAAFDVRVVVTELVRPDGPFNAWTEPLPFVRHFHYVLKAIAVEGGVRTEAAYSRYVANITATVCGAAHGDDTSTSSAVVRHSLFPMPATVFIGSC